MTCCRGEVSVRQDHEFEAGDVECCLWIHSSGWMSVRRETEKLSVPRREDVDLRRDVSEANRGDEEVLGRYGFKERTAEGHIVVDLAKRMKMAGVNNTFQEEGGTQGDVQEWRNCTQVDYISAEGAV